jgi:hypothetical protein
LTQTAYLLCQESHRECLIKQTQLARFTLLVIGVSEYPTIEQCTVNIGNHGTDVSCTVWGFGWIGEFDGVEIVDDGWVEVHGVTLIEGVDLSAGGYLDLDCVEWNA